MSALDDRWWSSGVVGEWRGSRRVFDMSKICNVLANVFWNARWTFCERSKPWTIVRGRWESAWERRRAHDGRWKSSKRPPNAPQAPSYSQCTVRAALYQRSWCALPAFVHLRSLTVILSLRQPQRSSIVQSDQVPIFYSPVRGVKKRSLWASTHLVT